MKKLSHLGEKIGGYLESSGGSTEMSIVARLAF